MKKTLSVLLAMTIVLSCAAVFGVSATTGEAKDSPVYLLGDANLDGKVSIADVTEVQRQLAEFTEMSGLQTKLSQVDGNDLTIGSATLIQQYLAEMDTGLSIGEPAGDENEGVIYSEKLMYYIASGASVISQEDKSFFSTAYPDVAFVSDGEALMTFVQSAGYQMSDMTVTIEENYHVYNLPNGTSVIFDYDDKMMIFSDYSTFTTPNNTLPLYPFGTGFPPNSTLYENQPSTKYFGGDPCAMTFDYKEVPMLKSGDDIFIPLQTFCDFFMTPLNVFVQYNGKDIYMMHTSIATLNPDFWQQYCDATEKKEQISDALAQVNYYELCNILEARYGLRKAHYIDDFDAYFKRRGLKSDFLSGNVRKIEEANNKMGMMLFEDFHSGANSQSPFFDGTLDTNIDDASPVFVNRQQEWAVLNAKRQEFLGDTVAPYERRGDTVFITFDSFECKGFDDYYQDGYEPDPNSGDSIDLFAYALRRLQNEDSDAKNVVVDIACNGGGQTLACGYIMDALIGKCIICMQNPNTAALTQNVTKFDLNLDGVIDENDKSMKAMGKHIALVISDSSFSCGNLLPCSLNALDPDVLLLGQQSGGGSCVVGRLSNAIGSVMQISGERMLVTMKNGYIRDIDGGVAPHIPLSDNRIFDRDYIVSRVDDYFG